jgi:hypothetical protein
VITTAASFPFGPLYAAANNASSIQREEDTLGR